MRLLLFVLCTSVIVSCQMKAVPDELIGTWQATSLHVLDSIWQVEVDPVQLSIGKDLQYKLNWYGGAVESGKITIDGNWMHIIANNGSERKIRILFVGTDSLAISGPINDQRTEIGFVRIPIQEPGL